MYDMYDMDVDDEKRMKHEKMIWHAGQDVAAI